MTNSDIRSESVRKAIVETRKESIRKTVLEHYLDQGTGISTEQIAARMQVSEHS